MWADQVRAVNAANRAASLAYESCVESAAAFGCGRLRLLALPAALPTDPKVKGKAKAAQPPAAVLAPEEIAYAAVAQLRLTPPRPMIGPPPELNEWKMAAVGYPLWLWAEGDLNPAPVSDSVFDIAVSLDARLTKVVFDMGDGHKVVCTDLQHRWVQGRVAPGTPSPACGYAYPRPSLPNGSYTITAHAVWAIDWTINGTRGTLPLFQDATTEVPVGELQVLIR
ncbi:MAG: hypothetical protein JWP61_2276 [Friedmanniella sp.]|nr:hypothetical protein [Friedmanniella sp.]